MEPVDHLTQHHTIAHPLTNVVRKLNTHQCLNALHDEWKLMHIIIMQLVGFNWEAILDHNLILVPDYSWQVQHGGIY